MSGRGGAGAWKCPGCECENPEPLGTCRGCGAPLPAGAAAAGDAAGLLDDDSLTVGEADFMLALPAGRAADPPFCIDDDLFEGPSPFVSAGPEPTPASEAGGDPGGFWTAADLPGPAFAFSDAQPGTETGGEPIIDRDDEVPDRYWAPEVAGLGRRALALLVDQALVLAVLGLFFLGAFLSLRLNGLDTGVYLGADGVRASVLPFGLLAVLLSLALSIFFHGSTGRTPGKALVGIEVRTSSGRPLSRGRALLRWCGALLGLACAGVGILWACFEPRRRGWADLISGTVVARPRR